MEALAERVRQALGLGHESFVPSSLEAQDATLKELDVFAAPLRDMLKATEHFHDDTKELLDASAKYVTDAPFPRMWVQASPTEPATALDIPVPADQAAWFDAELHQAQAETVPAAVGYAIKHELVRPIKMWLLTHDVAKSSLSSLESRRLHYDAQRRKLVQEAGAAAKAAGASKASTSEAAGGAAQVTLVTAGPDLAQLQEDAAATSSGLAEYEADVEALSDQLAWLVGGAARLKAAIADAAGGIAAAATVWQVPAGVMPELPEKSYIGTDVEITLSLAEAPKGAAAEGETSRAADQAAPAAAPAAPQVSETAQIGTTTIAAVAGGAEGLARQDLGGDSTTSSDSSVSDVGGGAAVQPDLSKVFPSDDKVYAGGVAPSAHDTEHPPAGGGVASLLKDTLVGTAGSDEATEEYTDTAAAVPELSGRPSRTYSGEGVGRVEARISDDATAGLGAGQRRVAESLSADSKRNSLSLPGPAMSPDVTVANPDQKQLSTVVVAQDAVVAPCAGLVAPVTDAGTGAAADNTAVAAAESSSASGNSRTGGGLMAAIARTIKSAMGGGTQQEQSGVEGSKAEKQHGSEEEQYFDVQGAEGVYEATTATQPAEEGPTAATMDAPTSEGQEEQHIGPISPISGSEPDPGSAHWVKDATPPGGAAAAGLGAPATAAPTHQGAMHVGPVAPFPDAEPAPGSAHWVKDTTPPGGAAATGVPAADTTAAHTPSTAQSTHKGEMHVGPVPPVSVSEPAAGSAHWVKDATPPGGAAATGVDVPRTAGVIHQGEMPIGPVPPVSVSEPAAGSAHWVKDATPPGGAAAAAEGAAARKTAANAPAGDNDVSSGKNGPDLSKILPSGEPATTPGQGARPSGEGVGGFLKELIMGPGDRT